MEEMLGKDYVIRAIDTCGHIGLPSPDGSHGGIWYFPSSTVKLWKDTKQGKEPPLPRLATKVMGNPSHTGIAIESAAPHAAPWQIKITGKNLMKPIVPHTQISVDFEESALRLPPWMKVRKILSVECLEKLHKDPKYECTKKDPVVTTTAAPMSAAKAKKLRQRVRHLESTIRSLTEPRKYDKSVGHPVTTKVVKKLGSLNKAVTNQEDGGSNKDMSKDLLRIVGEGHADSTLPTAQGHAEDPCKK
jgi:hypothetical protein